MSYFTKINRSQGYSSKTRKSNDYNRRRSSKTSSYRKSESKKNATNKLPTQDSSKTYGSKTQPSIKKYGSKSNQAQAGTKKYGSKTKKKEEELSPQKETTEIPEQKPSPSPADEQKELIERILGSEESPVKKKTDSKILVHAKLIKTIRDLSQNTDGKTSPSVINLTDLESRVSEIENYLAILSVDIQKIKENQKLIMKKTEVSENRELFTHSKGEAKNE